MHRRSWLLVLITTVILSAAFQFYSPKVFDPDAFYHLTHAKIYRTEGITFSDFPWTQFSVIKNLKADIWYGFHLLLIPLTFFNDPVFGIKLGSFLLTTLVLLSFCVLFKKLAIRWAWFWPLLFFFFIPDTHYRFLVLRPHLITFILGLIIFYFAVRKNNPGILVATAFLTFVHLALGWVPLLIVLAVFISGSVLSNRFEFKPLLATAVGLLVGIATRPNFFGALKLAYVQIVELMLAKFKNVPLRLGAELRPGNNLSLFIHEILPLLLVVAVAVFLLARALKNKSFKNISEERKIAVVSSLVISFLFGLMTVFIARRAIDLWVGFSFIFVGLVFSLFAGELAASAGRHRRIAIMAGLILVLTMLSNTLYYSLFKYPSQSPDHRNLKPAAEWLKENSQEGEIVFHAYWDNFPTLFFYNQKNYYINGMDPIFLHAFDPSLNIKFYFFAIDKLLQVGNEFYTCGANPCVPGTVVSAYDAIKKDFGASYVFVEPVRSPRFYQYLKQDERFEEKFTSPGAAVFKVL